MLRAFSLPRFIVSLLIIISFAALLPVASPASAQTAPGLGTAGSFAVLGGSTVTNTGPTTVNGDLGVSPGSVVTGFPPGIVNGGVIHSADAVALQAQSDVTTAYNVLAGQSCPGGNNLTGQDLGGLTLTSGVYCFSSSAQLTGQLTLNAQGNPTSVFIFQIGSTLTTATGSSVIMTNGGSGCNVWWQVGSSATLGTTTAFQGNILALTSITLNTGASLIPGRALARNGAVTLDTNRITKRDCSAGGSHPPPAATPRPSNLIQYTICANVTPLDSPNGSPVSDANGPIVLPAGQSWLGEPQPVLGSDGRYYIKLYLGSPNGVFVPVSAINCATQILSTPAPAVVGLPNTGGGPPQGAGFPWMLVLGVASLSATALGLRVRAHRRAQSPRQ